jgi:capsule polysaccharide export protein KpsE/RkpR
MRRLITKKIQIVMCFVLFALTTFAATTPISYTVTVTEGGRTTEKISDAVIRALSGFSSANNDSANVTVIIPSG